LLVFLEAKQSGWRRAWQPGIHDQLLWEAADRETPAQMAVMIQAVVLLEISLQNARRSQVR